MGTKIRNLWERFYASIWLIPSVMVVAALVLSTASLQLDSHLGRSGFHPPDWLYAGGPAGATAVLTVVASSMMTVTGTVFSITVVALALASSQYGPRLLRSFTGDKGNQIVLGTFIGTFMYALLVLRAVNRTEASTYVPVVSYGVVTVLALASFGVLIYFIQNVSTSITADSVIGNVYGDLQRSITRAFATPSEPPDAMEAVPQCDGRLPDDFERGSLPVPSTRSGYVQAVDMQGLVARARDADVVIQAVARPGQFTVSGESLARVRPGHSLNEQLAEHICSAFVIGDRRVIGQDIHVALDELVEVAVRALSPGINDPFTAMTCIDRLTAALARIVSLNPPSSCYRDSDGVTRLVTPPWDFAGIVDGAFGQIRHYGRDNVPVTYRLMEAIGRVGQCNGEEGHLRALRRHADMIATSAQDWPHAADRDALDARHREAMLVLRSPLSEGRTATT